MNCNCVKEIETKQATALSQSFIGLSGSESFKYVLEQLATGNPNPKERRRLVREVRETIKACAETQRRHGADELSGLAWIRIGERLPEPYEEVRILFDGVPRIARLNHTRAYFQLATFIDSTKSQYIASFERVTGWMPLPSAPSSIEPTQRHIKLIADMLDDHQRTEPHHADLCPLCIEANAVLAAAGAA